MEGAADVLADGLSRHASPRTIAAFAAACRASRAAVRSQGDALWEALARRRWLAPRRAYTSSWRGLYCSGNGWSRLAWRGATLPNASDTEESEAAAWLGGSQPAEAGHVAVVSGGRLEVWSASVPCGGAAAAGAPATALRARSGPHAGSIVSLCPLGGGPAGAELILGGGRDGLLNVFEWRSGAGGGDGTSAGSGQGAGGPAQSAETAGGALRLASSLRAAGGDAPQPLCQIAPLAPAVVAGLYEDVFGVPASRSSTIRTWDLDAGREASRPVSSELGEGSHRAVAMCAPDRGGSSPPLVVAAYDGVACALCRDESPTLCYHKHRARSATLLEIDPRAPGGVVARYTAMHRSIQRHLATARGQFLFTAHAGMPLAAWDLRHMGAGPVFEEPRLLSPWEWREELGLAEAFDGPGGAPAGHQRHNPGRPPPSQAMWLQASHDTLLGRAKDSVWAWDLSATLGWAREPGTPMGAWAQLASEPWRVPLLRAGARAVPVADLSPAPGCDHAGGVAMLFPDHPACAFAYNEWEAAESHRVAWRLVRALPAQPR